MQDERSIAAEPGSDRRRRFGMQPDFARQRQELQRLFEIERRGVDTLWNARSLRLFIAVGFAELHVGPKAAGAQRNRDAVVSIAKDLAVERSVAIVTLRQLACEVAFGIVSAADEGSVLAGNLEAQASDAALRTLARIGAIAAIGENVRPENFVQGFQHVADAQILDLSDGAMKSRQKSRSTSL